MHHNSLHSESKSYTVALWFLCLLETLCKKHGACGFKVETSGPETLFIFPHNQKRANHIRRGLVEALQRCESIGGRLVEARDCMHRVAVCMSAVVAAGGVRENRSGSEGSRVDSVRVAVFIGKTKTESQAQAERCISCDREGMRIRKHIPSPSHRAPDHMLVLKQTNKVIFTYCSELFC